MSSESKFYNTAQIGRHTWTVGMGRLARRHRVAFSDSLDSKALLRNRFYYSLKPFLPFRTRLAIRRWFARRKREQISGSWPIMPGSERAPNGWHGWPDGKKFALVLTHDVEGQAGLDKIQKVMALEKQFGFHSSFTLIPRGEYVVPSDLRRNITAEGFEIGVHDLYHDGKLFLTESEFRRNAPEINKYLTDWGAVGFRSGFMLHNLDWLRQLNIRYDLSTFDTDPFEPQPQGRHTIFPFWVSRNSSGAWNGKANSWNGASRLKPSPQPPTLHDEPVGGYVELPYTLPQDSTLFILLRERNPEIWFQKLDWIAKHGGMALVNVHPDYMCFDGEVAWVNTYPGQFYRCFLQYARDRYGDSFWQPLPREVADHVILNR